ncbi:MAG: LysR family transcriptional regulator [Lachnospiraceae bacterium]|jgi:DNA-binding transcriptional LysR family regulator
MTIRSLRIFLEVTDCHNSVSEAARKLYVSQPSVSVAIRELEEEYNVKLFERLNRRLYLTEKGREFLQYARRICALADDTAAAMQDDGTGSLRAGASVSAGSCLMPQLIKRFRELNPNVKVRVTTQPSRQLEQKLLVNDLDLAICEIPVYNSSLVSEVILSDTLCACAAPKLRKELPEKLTRRELAACPLLLREKGSGTRTILDDALARDSLFASPVWEAASWEAILEAAKQGLGVAVLPHMTAEENLSDGTLVQIPLAGRPIRQDFTLVRHKDKVVTQAMKSFMSLAESQKK